MKNLIILLVMFLLFGCTPIVTTEEKLRERMEEAYFEGQKDCLNGKVCIQFTNDSCWVWTKSPWNSERLPTFNPCVIHSRE